jgi:hypothetical protein
MKHVKEFYCNVGSTLTSSAWHNGAFIVRTRTPARHKMDMGNELKVRDRPTVAFTQQS